MQKGGDIPALLHTFSKPERYGKSGALLIYMGKREPMMKEKKR
jgi:hypothetical protein